MRLWIIPTIILFAACSSASQENPLVAEIEASLASMTRDTATLVRQPGPDLFVEAHSDSTGYRRIRVVESGSLRTSSATAYFDDRSRQRVVESSAIGLNPGDEMDGDEIEDIAAMVFGTTN